MKVLDQSFKEVGAMGYINYTKRIINYTARFVVYIGFDSKNLRALS